jgi:hypothetical protein
MIPARKYPPAIGDIREIRYIIINIIAIVNADIDE